MRLKLIGFVMVAAFSQSGFAAENFVIRLNQRKPADVLTHAERVIREISVQTGSGEVGARSRRGYVTANLSPAGAASVRDLPGVAHVAAAGDLEKLLLPRAAVSRAAMALGAALRPAPSCSVRLGAIARLGAERLTFGQRLSVTFRDDDGVEYAVEYRFERLRLTDGKIKMRLRDDAGPVQLVGTLDHVETRGSAVEVTLRVHRRSGSASALALGRGVRARFTP